MSLFWFSFVDPDLPPGSRWLGACLVEVEDREGEPHVNTLQRAIERTHILGCNPGGAVKAHGLPEDAKSRIDAKWLNRLLSRSDVDAFDEELRRVN